MSDVDWSERPRLARAGLEPIAFLLGEWVGAGTSDGAPIHGRLTVASVMGGTFFEAREELRLPDGTLDHEDRVFYRYVSEDHTLRALHLQAPAWSTDRYVNLLAEGDGLMWSGGPTNPRVQIVLRDDQLHVQVWLPGDAHPSTHLVYDRA